MPKALDADLRSIANHPGVRRVAAVAAEDGGTTVDIDVDVGLGSRFLERGHGENGVRPIEPVTLIFPSSYPIKGPFVRLRQDFERNLPHMLPRRPGTAPSPCVIDGEAADFIAQRGMPAFIGQIVQWLYKAAHDALIDPNQGWEPIRRDETELTFIADPDHLRGLARKEGSGTTLMAATISLDDEWTFVRGVVSNELQTLMAPLISPARHPQLPSLAIVVHPPANGADGKRLEDASYAADAVTTMADVYATAQRYGCLDRFEAQMSLLRHRLGQMQTPIGVWMILFVRRPMRIRDQESDLEMVGYFAICQKPGDAAASSTLPVLPARHHNALTRSLLQRMSDRNATDRPSWALIGAGSLGSKIALHLGRQGDGPDLIADMHGMLPHNYARHGLLPDPMGAPGSGLDKIDRAAFASKSEALAYGIEMLGQICKAVRENMAAAPYEALKPVLGRRRLFLLDTTASHHVLGRLCASDVVGRRPRLAAASLLGAGSIGRLLVEGPKSNPDGLEIETWSLGHLEKDEHLASLAAQTGGRAVPIGQGCVSLTAVMSDARLSAMAAPISDCLSAYLDHGLPEKGEVVLGTLEADGLSRSFKRHPVPAFRRLAGPDGSMRASVAADLVQPSGRPVPARGRRVRLDGRIVVTDNSDGPSGQRFLDTVGLIVRSKEEVAAAASKADEMARQDGTSIILWPADGLWKGEIRTVASDGTIELVAIEEMTS